MSTDTPDAPTEENDTLDNVEPIETNLDYKPDTSIPDTDIPDNPDVQTEETDEVLELLKKYEKHPTNKVKNIDTADRFIIDNYPSKPKDEVFPIIDHYCKKHFGLSAEDCKNVRNRWKRRDDEAKAVAKEAKATAKEAEKAEKQRKFEEDLAERNKLSAGQLHEINVEKIENGLSVAFEFKEKMVSLKSIYTGEEWKTTLYLDEKELITESHESPMYVPDKKRDNAFAKRLMIEFGESVATKFLKPIYAIIDLANDNKDMLNEVSYKAHDDTSTGTLPYKSSKQPIMETKYLLDQKTHRLYNTETMKYYM